MHLSHTAIWSVSSRPRETRKSWPDVKMAPHKVLWRVQVDEASTGHHLVCARLRWLTTATGGRAPRPKPFRWAHPDVVQRVSCLCTAHRI